MEGGEGQAYSFLCSANETDDLHDGTPAFKLGHPVGQGGFGDNDEMGPGDILHQAHVPKQGNGLKGLP